MVRQAAKRLETVRLTDLRSSTVALKRLRKAKGPLIIVQNGKAAGVMLSVKAYERAEREKEILRLLARGEREIAAGKGRDLGDVLKEADRLLADD